MELSFFSKNSAKRDGTAGTGVPPSLLDEVQERRSGACRGAGTAYRLVPAEIKHCLYPELFPGPISRTRPDPPGSGPDPNSRANYLTRPDPRSA